MYPNPQNIMMLTGGACQVRYPCGHTAMFAANETISPCRECIPDPRPVLTVVK